MVTIKSHTDLEQSRKLAEILPLESADMYYDDIVDRVTGELFIPDDGSTIKVGKGLGGSIAAWSLAALLGAASTYCNRLEITLRTNKKYNVFAVKSDFVFRSFDEFPDGIDNLIDCSYEMIIRLHKLNLL